MSRNLPTWETRSPERLQAHYRIERELAARLRSASSAERRTLYTPLYDELFRRVPDVPHAIQRDDPRAAQRLVAQQLRLLSRFLTPFSTYLEIGAGDCLLASAVAARVARVYALDVSTELTQGRELPENLQLVLSDGCSVPLPPASVSLAYSNQVLEHVHPDDVSEHLAELTRALKPGGSYVCVTPNRLSGPHDISRYFDNVATGFHLKEYSASELVKLFHAAGFGQVRLLLGDRLGFRPIPVPLVQLYEGVLERLPVTLRRRLARWKPIYFALSLVVVATR